MADSCSSLPSATEDRDSSAVPAGSESTQLGRNTGQRSTAVDSSATAAVGEEEVCSREEDGLRAEQSYCYPQDGEAAASKQQHQVEPAVKGGDASSVQSHHSPHSIIINPVQVRG